MKNTKTVQTRTLDSIIYEMAEHYHHPAEIIRVDGRGATHEILGASSGTSKDQCMSVWLEVEFPQICENRKTFSNADLLLRSQRFSSYALYTKYISKRLLGRRRDAINERVLWADTIYFKNPFEPKHVGTSFTERQINVLIFTALITGFFDYAEETIQTLRKDAEKNKQLMQLTRFLGAQERRKVVRPSRQFVNGGQKTPPRTYLLAENFVNEDKHTNDMDFITIKKDVCISEPWQNTFNNTVQREVRPA